MQENEDLQASHAGFEEETAVSSENAALESSKADAEAKVRTLEKEAANRSKKYEDIDVDIASSAREIAHLKKENALLDSSKTVLLEKVQMLEEEATRLCSRHKIELGEARMKSAPGCRRAKISKLPMRLWNKTSLRLRSSNTSLEGHVSAYEFKAQTLEDDVVRLEKNANEKSASFAALEAQLASVIKAANSSVDRLRKDVERAEGELADANRRLQSEKSCRSDLSVFSRKRLQMPRIQRCAWKHWSARRRVLSDLLRRKRLLRSFAAKWRRVMTQSQSSGEILAQRMCCFASAISSFAIFAKRSKHDALSRTKRSLGSSGARWRRAMKGLRIWCKI